MTDQATQLRRLAAGAQSHKPTSSARRTHVVAVAAGKGGVGTTTVAIGLAAALASEEQSSLLVDGNVNNPDVLAACGVVPRERHHAATGVTPWGPTGMHIATELPADSAWLNQTLHESSADIAIVDAGNGLNRTVRDLWQVADQVVLVTGQDPIAAMDAYAAVKLMATDADQPISTLINQATSEAVAAEIHTRIAHACQRFLGISLVAGGYVPTEPSLAKGQHIDVLDCFRSGQAMRGFRRLAQQVARNASKIPNNSPMSVAAA